ncbi:hypothetical protein [Nocardiopsis sp. CC223A]|uniref:DUF6891 domain-containing protein n=1 Tax=Nocardiopsis sp. CC223A TaxID=3044051 RepID=UPI00278BCAA1|nr:hypothetical protein [Nocardiopsis sp. CC223A]
MSTPFDGLNPEDVLGEVLENLRTQVALGLRTFDEIVAHEVEDYVIDGLENYVFEPHLLPEADREQTRAWLVSVLDAEFAAHLSAQGEDGEPTDAERLTAAFEELDAAGIVARESFECCNRCAYTAMPGEISSANGEREESPPAHGFVFYHAQDAERLRPYLGFGAVGTTGAEAEKAVGREIVETLRRHGLAPEWNGDPEMKILGPSLVRRRTGRLADHPSRST